MTEELDQVKTTAPDAKPEAPSTSTEPENTEAPEPSGDDSAANEPEPKPAKGVQKRIDELTRQKNDERRRADELQRMLDKVIGHKPESKPNQQTPAEFQPTRPAPKLEQFDYDVEKFTAEMVKWDREQERERSANERRQAESAQKVQTFQQKIDKAVEAGKAKYEDFDQVVMAPDVPIDQDMVMIMAEMDNAPDVAYHLAKNPDEAKRISALPPIRKATELGKLEAKLASTVKPTTNAPPPVQTVGGRGSGTKNPDDMPIGEWMAWREGQIAKRR